MAIGIKYHLNTGMTQTLLDNLWVIPCLSISDAWVSAATINQHSENIRRKLKITNNEVNLATFLPSSMWEEE